MNTKMALRANTVNALVARHLKNSAFGADAVGACMLKDYSILFTFPRGNGKEPILLTYSNLATNIYIIGEEVLGFRTPEDLCYSWHKFETVDLFDKLEGLLRPRPDEILKLSEMEYVKNYPVQKAHLLKNQFKLFKMFLDTTTKMALKTGFEPEGQQSSRTGAGTLPYSKRFFHLQQALWTQARPASSNYSNLKDLPFSSVQIPYYDVPNFTNFMDLRDHVINLVPKSDKELRDLILHMFIEVYDKSSSAYTAFSVPNTMLPKASFKMKDEKKKPMGSSNRSNHPCFVVDKTHSLSHHFDFVNEMRVLSCPTISPYNLGRFKTFYERMKEIYKTCVGEPMKEKWEA